jgi:hypothetical protein
MNRHPYGTIDPFLQIDIADNILDEVFRITGQLKIRAFLTIGLCLGFVRDGGYIEEDNDLDIGVICNGGEEGKLINSLKENGFSQGKSYRHHNTHFHKNKVLVDVYFLESKGFFSNLDSVQYKGREYPVPSPIEEYLSVCYSNWKVKEDEVTHYYG